jgi:hypothetical protein
MPIAWYPSSLHNKMRIFRLPSENGGGVITTILNSAKVFLTRISIALLSAVLLCLVFEHHPRPSSIADASPVDAKAIGWPSAKSFQRRPSSPSVVNLDRFLQVITQEPHPMGSEQQRRLAQWMVEVLKHFGWKAEEQRFTVKTPAVSSKEKKLEERTGRNVVAWRQGPDDCAFMIVGHYDSKYFPPEVRFVGANDGGSSTALMLELARLWTHPLHALVSKQKSAGTWFECDVVLAFFDGEEAFLPEWSDGERLFGVRDNLYGSRDFVNRLQRSGSTVLWNKKPIRLVLNIDMVGHKKQNLFITSGSDPLISEQLIALRGNVQLRKVPLAVEDDHVPFMRLGVPVVHMIDWTNLQEWHTPRDNLEIVSAEKIAALTEVLMKFSERKRP